MKKMGQAEAIIAAGVIIGLVLVGAVALAEYNGDMADKQATDLASEEQTAKQSNGEPTISKSEGIGVPSPPELVVP